MILEGGGDLDSCKLIKGKYLMEKIKFKYHPNIYEDDVLVKKEGTCKCCGKIVNAYVESMYSAKEADRICLKCISDGSAAEKFDGVFVAWAEPVSDPEKKKELFNRTPGYLGWQGENWLACCDDYCEYLGRVGMEEINKMPEKNEILTEYFARDDAYQEEDVIECMYKDGDMSGYLFRCLHCKKYHLWVDTN